MKQMTFADAEYAGKRKQTRKELFLIEMDRVVPWKGLIALIEPHYPKGEGGRPAYPLMAMLRVHLLQNWFGGLDWQRLALALVGTGALLIGLLALWLLKPWQQRPDPQRQAFRKFERLLARHDVRREAGEGARSFALRAAQRLPEQAAQIETFARCFEQQRYAGGPVSRDALRKALSDLRSALPWRLSR